MKKGFTLVELIAVIVILATVAMIVFPNISEIIYSSRQQLHDTQINDIEKSAEKWATDNIELLDKYYLNTTYIPLKSIQNTGYLEKEKITDPLNKEEMNGCIEIKYNISNKKYNFTYKEETCETFATENDDGTHGYIIYEYDSKEKKILESTSSKKYEPTGLTIYNYYVNHNMLYVDGETNSGLYELEDSYVFRGNDVNNYVTFESKTWRILSINKDFSMNLIKVSGIPNSFDQDGKIEFQNASSNVDILKQEDIDNEKVLANNFEIDVIDGNSSSRRALSSTLGKNVTSSKTGLISVLDYVNASATLSCTNDYLSLECKDNNYLYTMFTSSGSTWTLNNNGSQVWYIDTDGALKLENTTSIKYLYPVIRVSANTYITNPDIAVGSTSSPYRIK